jgi:hypothetical protein
VTKAIDAEQIGARYRSLDGVRMVLEMKYYFYIYHGQAESVHGWHETAKGDFPEMWNGKEWAPNPQLIQAAGIGGWTDYEETTEEKALAFMASHTQKS